MSASFPFLRLPLELREAIYGLYFSPADRLRPHMRGGGQYKFEFDLLRTNKQIYYEALTVFRRENVFIRIETPWAETGTTSSIFAFPIKPPALFTIPSDMLWSVK